ncbi:N/A [soil metagenome]
MSETEIALLVLSPDECRALLATHRPRLGRLAFVDAGWPLVLPMNFVIDGNAIYFRSAPGSKLAAAVRAERVAFELDHVDAVWEEGWSLLAFGRLHIVTDPDELTRARQLPLRPWAGGDRPHYLRLDIASLSGRRIT